MVDMHGLCLVSQEQRPAVGQAPSPGFSHSFLSNTAAMQHFFQCTRSHRVTRKLNSIQHSCDAALAAPDHTGSHANSTAFNLQGVLLYVAHIYGGQRSTPGIFPYHFPP